ncbi:unnamed protein product [Didymodactylos carnosus]|uniref:Uncharacterized protein n=1 Tax=Didymodactylos carnosus TaxID=1234261 RepID=A0A8S2EIZ8_9BILA|nr:unnamed protein product [Didymodactylos carnosus]CAF4029571.1 unnamed protein product [Didymodactylos carnosus]
MYIRIPFDIDTPTTTTTIATRSERPLSSVQRLVALNIPTSLPPRAPQEIKAENIVQFMRDAWNLQVPNLIISVTGGAKYFKFTNPRIRNDFQHGLVAVALTTRKQRSVILGIMKEVGDAIDKCRYKNTKTPAKIPCIAICSWDYTTDVQQLEQKTLCQIKNEDIKLSDRVMLYRTRHPLEDEKPDSAPLDPNHTHFIILDDQYGTNEDWKNIHPVRSDLILKLRAEIEQAARKINSQGQATSVPIVQILAEGGASSILTVCKAVKSGTPLIVIERTGRAADIIAREYKDLYGSGEMRTFEAYTKIAASSTPKFNSLNTKEFNVDKQKKNIIINPNNKDEFIDMITSKNGYFLINIFQFRRENREYKLNDAILTALLNAAKMTQTEKSRRIEELKLAMAWNKFDLVKRNMLNDKIITEWTDNELDQALQDALRLDSVQFTELLTEYGASFDRLRRLIKMSVYYLNVKNRELLPLDKNGTIVNDDQQYHYYRTYLDKMGVEATDVEQKKLLAANSYGTTDSNKELFKNLDNKVAFCTTDVIRRNGYVDKVSINFHTAPDMAPHKAEICLYVISPTIEPDMFNILYRSPLPSDMIKAEGGLQTIHLSDSSLYLEIGQFLAIDFKDKSGSPSAVDRRKTTIASIDDVKNGYENQQPVKFGEESKGVAFSFTLIPVQALIASKIYRKAANLKRESEVTKDFVEKEREFDKHAAIIIDRCFDEDEDFAVQILTTKSKLYLDYSPIRLAKENNNRSFLATKTVQKYLDGEWFGRINNYGLSRGTVGFLLFILCICPPLIPCPYFYKYIKLNEEKKLSDENKPNWFKRQYYKLCQFYTGRAIVRFYYNILFYIIFLALFSFVLLVDYFPLNIYGGKRNGYYKIYIPITEIFVHILVWTLIVEEIREV